MSLLTCRRRGIGKSLPYDAELQYINMNGVRFLLEAFSGNNYRIELTIGNVVFHQSAASGAIIIGYYNSSGEMRYINRNTTTNKLNFNWNKTAPFSPNIPDVTDKTLHIALSANMSNVVVDGVSYSDNSVSQTVTTPNQKPFYVGALVAEMNLVDLKLYNGNVIVYDLIAVRKNGLPYVFDKVTSTFVAGGTEGYTGGPDK